MKQPAARLLSVASSRAPWLLPAVGIALFVHKHFICYQSQGTAAANAKARSRPPKLRRAVKKAQLHKDVAVVNEDCAASAEQERLDAMGLGNDKLMEWFTEDEVEALQQAQANPSAQFHLMSGSRFRLDEQYAESDDDWYTDHTYDSYGYDSRDPEYNNYLDTLDNFANSNADDSTQGGFEIMPLSGLSNALSNSDGSAASSPTAPGQQQQQWQAAQQLLQQLTDLVHHQQQQQSAPAADSELHSNADSADYFNHQEYYALSPAANRRGRASLDILQGNYLPRSGALWASSYPPHMDDLDSDEDVNLNEYLDREYQQDHGYLDREYPGATRGSNLTGSASAGQAVGGNQVGAGGRAGSAAAANNCSNTAPQQQQQQRYGRSSARWLAESEPPMPDFEPDFEPDFDFDPDYGYDYDYEPDYVPGFDDALGFDQLDAAFAAVAAAAAAPV